MFCFHKKKKKKNATFFVIGIVIGVAAAVVGGYYLFNKFLKDKICKKNEFEADEEIYEDTVEETSIEVVSEETPTVE